MSIEIITNIKSVFVKSVADLPRHWSVSDSPEALQLDITLSHHQLHILCGTRVHIGYDRPMDQVANIPDFKTPGSEK